MTDISTTGKAAAMHLFTVSSSHYQIIGHIPGFRLCVVNHHGRITDAVSLMFLEIRLNKSFE